MSYKDRNTFIFPLEQPTLQSKTISIELKLRLRQEPVKQKSTKPRRYQKQLYDK